MPLLNSLGANGDASATRRLPRRRNLVRNALREVEQFFPREQWMTVVVQGDQTVRVTLFGGEHSRAFEQPAGAASTSTTIPQPTARSAPTAREISRNNRARLHQLSQGFYSKQLLRRASFRAIARARDASGDVSSPPARAEGVPPPAPQVPSAAGLSEPETLVHLMVHCLLLAPRRAASVRHHQAASRRRLDRICAWRSVRAGMARMLEAGRLQ